MALIAVDILLQRLSTLIEEEVKLLGGVGREVNEIKDELETMKAFLQDADARSETDQGVKTWVKQVRELAYDTEDVLDNFLVRLVQPRKHGIFTSILYKLRYIKHLKTHHLLATEIQDIKTRIKTISERRKAYAFTSTSEGTRIDTTSDGWHDPRVAALYIDEAEVVGIEMPKNILIGWLTKGEPKLTVISVVGMGGLGKTTLVKKVYDNQIVKGCFECHAWITVSKSFIVTELLRAVIKGVLQATKERAPEGMDVIDDGELIKVLKSLLWRKRYVIIFDDVWSINAWEAMKFAFPNCECGSRIMFTTRMGDVAASIENTNYVYHLQPLPEGEAWRLFCMKAFRSYHENSCPKELEELSRNILKKCSGLPLAIETIGGLLSRRDKKVLEWRKIHDSLGAEMRNNYNLESLGRILLLSYNNLPYYLKPCYLYLSVFPEDYFIRRMTLIRLWIAEGFIEEKQGLTMEEVADDYIKELISRSMIQVAERNISNEVKSCRIHDLLRELVQLKSKEESFSVIVGSNGMELHEKARRLSIHNICENYFINTSSSCVRSLMIFGLDESPHSFQQELFHAFRLLRVLDLEGIQLEAFPPQLAELIHLRYLSLRRTKITVLPRSVGKLKNMETLDLKQTRVSVLPAEILKLQHLRHLLVYYGLGGVSVPTGIGNLRFLQKLAVVDVHQDNDIVKELGKLTQLRKLGISNLRSKDGRDLCLALGEMKHLNTLNARSTNDNEFLGLESLSTPPQLLHHLYLRGRLMKLPVWIASLRNLVILHLTSAKLCEDPLNAFQHMPNLVFLWLGAASYDGEELCCEVGGYPRLKKLLLHPLERLKSVRFMEGSMCMLQELFITACLALEILPLGIEQLSNLQELRFFGMPPEFMDRIRRREGEDCWKIEHIPRIRQLYENQNGQWELEDFRCPDASLVKDYRCISSVCM